MDEFNKVAAGRTKEKCKMMEYNIDLTENGYSSYEGSIENADIIKNILYKDDEFADCVGTIKNADTTLWIASVKENGVYLGYAGEEQYMSCSDIENVENLIDVWGDGLFVSEGLFIEAELAWKAICTFIEKGIRLEEINWVLYEEVPENANFLI